MSIKYKPFENVEEVWFWFCIAVQARGDGLRSRNHYDGEPREIEPADVYRIIKKINNRELRTMIKWGIAGFPPHYDRRAKNSEIRLWDSGIANLEYHLRCKGVLA